jgi:hypothetical protein
MSKSITVTVDEATFHELERLAHERGARLEEALAEALEAYLEQRKTYASDSFFQIGRAGHSGLRDLAKAHDRYLYGLDNN